jgi:hypothetical protein
MTELLKYSTCVKKCPTKTSKVECFKPSYMFAQSNYYSDCQYSWNGVTFRYDTTVALGKFCIPSETALAEDALKEGLSQFLA